VRILVLDGNQNQAVASVRSLAKAGHEVFVGESSSWSKAGWSRYCHAIFQYPSAEKQPARFVTEIAGIVKKHPGTLVLPMTEATTLPLSAQREEIITAGGRLVLPDHDYVLRAFNKQETVQLAASLGVRVPATSVVNNAAEAASLSTTANFPLVLKPRSTVEVRSDGAMQVTGRPRYAKNADEFLSVYREISSRSACVLVQEFVKGEGTGYFALMCHGKLRAEFAHRRIRDVHPTGSGSALRISVEPDPQVRQASLAILQALNWHGVAMVEFRHDPGQAPVFMEVNGRFWNSLPLACYAGMDFPALLAEMAENGDTNTVTHYRTGVLCRWLLGDFRHLIEVWRGAPAGYPEPYPGRISTLLSVLKPVPGTFHDNFQWQDPLPELGDWLSFLRRAFEKARS
jgi:predicted ATP-grasp superfamily ATP-dependent carboligase